MSEKYVHPTILIGYGRYGLRALQRLLMSSSPRGFLAWDRDESNGSPGIRRLRDLELLWVPEQPERPQTLAGGYFLRDLYGQIVEIQGDHPAQALTMAMARAKNRLIAAGKFTGNRAKLRPGLDIYIVAQPTRIESLGLLEETLEPAFNELARDQTLQSRADGADLLNLTAMLDFDRYWENETLQLEVQQWLARWCERDHHFGRVYISDGQIETGYRDEDKRLDELALFLEFLLFEGLRAEPKFRALYQPANANDIKPLAAFGIRVIERSSEWLSRLAAAQFASKWLAYMVGKDSFDPEKARAVVSSCLSSYYPDALDLEPERVKLEQSTKERLREVQDRLIEFTCAHAEDSDWAAQIREKAQIEVVNLRSDTAAWAGDRAAKLIEAKLSGLTKNLHEAITQALHADYDSAPLGLVLEELKRLEESLGRAAAPRRRAPAFDVESEFVGIEEVHARYLRFRALQINPSFFANKFLPIYALAVTTAWAPVLVAAVREIPRPEATASSAAMTLYDIAQFFSSYWSVGLLMLPAVFLVGWIVVRKWFVNRVDRGAAMFREPHQGELTDRIRKVVNNEQFRLGIDAYIVEIHEMLMGRVRGEILRELAVVIKRLEQRRAEMDWLRLQLQGYLRMQGVTADDRAPSTQGRRMSLPRISIETDEDLRRVAQKFPATPAEFQAMQSRQRPFKNWDQRYSPDFLYPLSFLDALSREYLQRPDEELLEASAEQARRERASQLEEHIADYGSVPIGIDWKEPNSTRQCVAPEIWLRLTGIESALAGHAYKEQETIASSDGERMYLLRTQTGVDDHVLTREKARRADAS